MNDFFKSRNVFRFNPVITRKKHLLLGAVLRSLLGVFLITRGAVLFSRVEQILWFDYFLLPLACIAGTLKSFLVLDKATIRNIERIQGFDDDICIGAVYPASTWLLVLCMVILGIVLRKSSLPIILVSFVCFVVGWALLFSSRYSWLAWMKNR